MRQPTKAKRLRSPDDVIMADWDTGEYYKPAGGTGTVSSLARKHNIAVSQLHTMLRTRPEGFAPLYSKLIQQIAENKQQLASLPFQNRTLIEKLAEDKASALIFFDRAAKSNIEVMAKKIGKKTSMYEHALAAKAIQTAKETVIGKQPDASVTVNNQQNVITRIERVIVEAPPRPAIDVQKA